jgi:hypothetical protein
MIVVSSKQSASESVGKSRGTTPKPRTGLKTGRREIQLDRPQAFADARPYAIWQKGGPGRLLRKLANEHAGHEVTLTPEELADLVELFRSEPLPDSLCGAVVAQLRGKRLRQQGAPKKRESNLELVEYIMLPQVYSEAVMQAKEERKSLKKQGRKQGRYDDPNRLPTVSSMACDKVRKWLPTLSGYKDRRLQNLVSEVKGRLSGEND